MSPLFVRSGNQWVRALGSTVPVIPENTAPSAPTALTISPGTTSATITWGAATDAEGPIAAYRVQLDGLVVQEANLLSYSATGLLSETTHTISVRAVDAEGLVSPAVSDSFTTLVSTGYPNESNTGVNPATTLTNANRYDFYGAPNGAVYSNYRIRCFEGSMEFPASDAGKTITFRNCLFVDANCLWLVLNEHAVNLVFEDCTFPIVGSASYADSCVSGGNFTLRRCNISGAGDGVKAGSNVLIEDCYIHDFYETAEGHNDGIQCLGTTNLTIRHNNILMSAQATSCIILSTGSASDMRNVTITDNLFTGGAYCVYGGYQEGADILSRVSNINITNNKFSTVIWPQGGVFGPLASVSPPVVHTGNTWFDGPNAGVAFD